MSLSPLCIINAACLPALCAAQPGGEAPAGGGGGGFMDLMPMVLAQVVVTLLVIMAMMCIQGRALTPLQTAMATEIKEEAREIFGHAAGSSRDGVPAQPAAAAASTGDSSSMPPSAPPTPSPVGPRGGTPECVWITRHGSVAHVSAECGHLHGRPSVR